VQQLLAGAAQVFGQQVAGAAHEACFEKRPPLQRPNFGLHPPEKQLVGAPQVGAQFVAGAHAIGAAQAGAHAAGAGQQLLAAGAAQAGAQAAAGAQQAGFGAGQQVAGAAQVLQLPWLCMPNSPHFEAGAQQDDGQQVSQHGGLISEQRR